MRVVTGPRWLAPALAVATAALTALPAHPATGRAATPTTPDAGRTTPTRTLGVPPPPNDAFATPTMLTGASGTVTQSTTGATAEKGDPTVGLGLTYGYYLLGAPNVWFRWTAPATGWARFTTDGSDAAFSLTIFEGATRASLKEIAAADSTYVAPPGTPVPVDAVATSTAAAVGPVEVLVGTTYTIGVAGAEAGLRLSWSSGTALPAPDNDVVPAVLPPIVATTDSTPFHSVAGRTAFATRATGEGQHGTVGATRSVWYRYTAPQDQLLSLDTYGSTFDTTLAVYDAATGAAIAANDDGSTFQRISVIRALQVRNGRSVLIAVDGWNGAHGAFRLQLGVRTTGPANDFFADATPISGSGQMAVDSGAATSESADELGDVWFRYQSPTTGTLRLHLDPPISSTYAVGALGVAFAGTDFTHLRTVGNFSLLVGYTSGNSFVWRPIDAVVTVTAGQPIWVRVFAPGFGAANGWTRFAWAFTGAAATAERFTPVAPTRVLDTRDGVRLLAGGGRTLRLAGVAGIPPTGATAAVINLTATGAAARGYLTATASGTSAQTSNLNVGRGQSAANLAIVPFGHGGAADGSIDITSSVATDVIVDVLGWIGTGGTDRYSPVTPTRLLDTRAAPGRRLAAGETIEVNVPVAAGGGVPDAVALTLTGTDAVAPGFVTAFPEGAPPATSNLNLRTDAPVANLVIVRVGADGKVRLRASAATHLIVDLAGVYAAASGAEFVAVAPLRVLDERVGGDYSPQPRYGMRQLIVAGNGGVPVDATAVVVNLTVGEFTAYPGYSVSIPYVVGYAQAYPTDIGAPTTSNLNFRPGADVANLAIVPIGSDGRIALRTSDTAALIVDVVGYYR